MDKPVSMYDLMLSAASTTTQQPPAQPKPQPTAPAPVPEPQKQDEAEFSIIEARAKRDAELALFARTKPPQAPASQDILMSDAVPADADMAPKTEEKEKEKKKRAPAKKAKKDDDSETARAKRAAPDSEAAEEEPKAKKAKTPPKKKPASAKKDESEDEAPKKKPAEKKKKKKHHDDSDSECEERHKKHVKKSKDEEDDSGDEKKKKSEKKKKPEDDDGEVSMSRNPNGWSVLKRDTKIISDLFTKHKEARQQRLGIAKKKKKVADSKCSDSESEDIHVEHDPVNTVLGMTTDNLIQFWSEVLPKFYDRFAMNMPVEQRKMLRALIQDHEANKYN